MTRCLLVSALMIAVGAQARAQTAPPLRITRDLRIDATAHDLSPIDWLAVSPLGTIIVVQRQDLHLRFFNSDGSPAGTFGRKGSGPGEFQWLGRHGWLGDTLWVDDPSTRRTTLISPNRQLVRSTVRTNQVTFPGTPADSVPVFASLATYALSTDGYAVMMGALAVGSPRPRWMAGTNNEWHYLRINQNGTFAGIFATRPENRCSVPWRDDKTIGEITVPFCAPPMDNLALDGRRYLLAVVENQSAPRVSYRITLIGAGRDTLLNKVFDQPALAVPRRLADSTIDASIRRAQYPAQGEAYRTLKVPGVFPPLSRVLLGMDDTIWLEQFSRAGQPMRRWLVIDTRGSTVGQVDVPRNFYLHAASRSAIWGLETDSDGLQHVVRYRVAAKGAS